LIAYAFVVDAGTDRSAVPLPHAHEFSS